jgi:hypothetical protein
MLSGLNYGGSSPCFGHLIAPHGPDLKSQHQARPCLPDKFQELYGQAEVQHNVFVGHLQVRIN